MEEFINFVLRFLTQFAGGPGPLENNLVRFGLPAVLWAILLYVAWTRQRTQVLPREKLLVWGFGLALVRELFMFGQITRQLLSNEYIEASCGVSQPIEHGLAMAAMIVVAGAFLRYSLADSRTARRYLQIGLTITFLVFVWASFSWPRQLAANPAMKFHQTLFAWLFHIPLALLMGWAIFLLGQKKGWLRNVVTGALGLYLSSELFLLINYATGRAYNYIICPLGNSFHILAIPLLGYVYLCEQSIEVKQAEELTRLHEASSYLTSSLDLDQVLEEVSRQSCLLLNCPKSCVVRLEPDKQEPQIAATYGFSLDQLDYFQKILPGWNTLRELAGQPRATVLQDPDLQEHLPGKMPERLGLRAALWVPIWSSEQPKEYILLLDEPPDRVWTPRELELIESLATRAAVAVVNARLHRQLELSAALEERQRIAANMHDGLAQTLSVLNQRVDSVQTLLESGSNQLAATVLQDVHEVVAMATADVRRSIASLQQAPRQHSSLQSLLKEFVSRHQTVGNPEIEFDPGKLEPLFLTPEKTDQVLSIVHEALMNAIHYAQAQKIVFHLEQNEAQTCLTISDDGCGFDPDDLPQNGDHFGLSIMQARAAHIQANFQIDSSPGNGTRVRLCWHPEAGLG